MSDDPSPGMPDSGDGGVMDEIITALHSVGGSEPEEIASVALALNQMLRVPTREIIEEWLDLPTPEGSTVRLMIQSGRASEVAKTLWGVVDDLFKATA